MATPRHNGKVERQHRLDEKRFYSKMRMYNLDDGRKIITATWNKDNFFGLADMPVGSKVSVRFKTAVSTGKTYLNYAEQV